MNPFDLLWLDNSNSGRLIILLIFGIAAISAWRGRRQRRTLHSEARQLQDVARYLIQWTGTQAASGTIEGAHQAQAGSGDSSAEGEDAGERTPRPGQVRAPVSTIPLASLVQLQQAAQPGSLIHERLECIEKLRRHRVKVNLGTLQGLSEARLAARPHRSTPGRAAHTVMMLGILGTFFGLSVMVQEIQFALPSEVTAESWVQSFENLTAVMGGIKTAFSTSLVGMAMALVLTRQSHRLADQETRLLEELERFTAEDLLPVAVPVVEDDTLLERVSLQLETSFGRLEAIYQQNLEALREISAAEESMVEILDSVRAVTRAQATQDLDEVVVGLSGAQEAVQRIVEQLPPIAQTIDRGQQRIADRLGQSAASISSAMGWSRWSTVLLGALAVLGFSGLVLQILEVFQ